jgi:hypothetical protein
LTTWSHRGIAWLRLSQDGRIVAPDGGVDPDGEPADQWESHGADVMDGAVAIHGHDFRWETAETAAAAIAEAITLRYADGYAAVSEADTCTVTAKTAADEAPGGQIELYVDTYKQMEPSI